MWRYRRGYFTNVKNGKVFTLKKDEEATPVTVENKYTGRSSSQIWRVVYTNEMGSEAIRKTG
jgi:hypothetical protein